MMEPATVLSITLGVVVVAFTALAVYTAFGPPSAELVDPFDEHDD